MKQLTTLILLVCLLIASNTKAQQNVGIGTTTPHASAALEVTANGKGILVPRMSFANRPTSPATGLLIYQTDVDSGFYYYTGSVWKALAPSSLVANGAKGRIVFLDSAKQLLSSNKLYWDTATNRMSIGTDTVSNNTLLIKGTGGVKINTTNVGNGATDWIGLNIGSADSTKERVVSGLLFGVPTIGAHNGALNAWSRLYINPLGGVTIGGTNAEPSAALEIKSQSNNQGVLLPRLTMAQRDAIAAPATGLMINQTDGKAGVYRYNSTNWQHLAEATTTITTPAATTFSFTGGMQTFTVPAGINQVTITANGAQGGFGVHHQPAVFIQYPTGGLGGTATGTFAVTPGQVLNVYVGGGPAATPNTATNGQLIPGGYNGGGSGMAEFTGGIYYIPGGGGGATDVRLAGNTLTDRIIVAAGGGGSTQRVISVPINGGNGGGNTGGNGGGGATGGTQTSGSSLGIGGNATVNAGAGGGGGYWGGNAGATDGAGGGGSSFFDPSATNTSTISGTTSGNGSVIISYAVPDTLLNFNYAIEGGKIRNINANNISGIVPLESLPTNVITGTGTVNFIPKFTGSTPSYTIANSTIRDNGTSISMGNANPLVAYQLYSFRQQQSGNGDGQATTMSYRTRNIRSDGSGYAENITNRASSGLNFWGDSYTFGDASYNYNDNERSGGNLGSNITGSYWASGGYRSSGSTNFGIYANGGLGGTTSGYGEGRLANGNSLNIFSTTNPAKGIGGGFVGDLMGSWSKGEVMGSISEGKLFASYNIGNAITDGKNIELVTTADGEKIPTYSVTSASVAKIYNDGTGQLTNGKARVNFDATFLATLAKEAKPTITISPVGGWANLYIANIDATGFDVAEANNGSSNIEFNYIVVGKKLSLNETPVSSEILNKDFSKNLPDVLFNEGNTKASAKPMWWDGTKFNYTTPPLNVTEIKAQRKKKELIAQEAEALKKKQ